MSDAEPCDDCGRGTGKGECRCPDDGAHWGGVEVLDDWPNAGRARVGAPRETAK